MQIYGALETRGCNRHYIIFFFFFFHVPCGASNFYFSHSNFFIFSPFPGHQICIFWPVENCTTWNLRYSQGCISRTHIESNNRLSRRSIHVLFSLYPIVLTPHKSNFLSRSYFFSPYRFDLGKVDCIWNAGWALRHWRSCSLVFLLHGIFMVGT